ncbi:MAG: DUF6282 family protein [Nitrospinae bacterium]|nr:DUF6282 family protein [Nitrospinota bacterium]
MRTKADDLLEGAIDVHAHIFPQVFVEEPGRVLDHEWAELARDVGMRGFVMKSHLWPTIAQARILNEVYPGVTAFGAITLNANVGGLSPFAAESAARLGVKVIWMPTYSAANDIAVGAYSKRIAEAYSQPPPAQGLTVMDADGAIRPEADAILEIARDADVAVATGHLSAEEGVALARRAKEIGVKKFIFTHPIIFIIDASEGQLREVADLGYIVEFTWISAFPMWRDLDPVKVAETARVLGPERCVMSTDAQLDLNPPPTEMLRMFIATMLRLGFEDEEIRWMVQRNPARLMGLEE